MHDRNIKLMNEKIATAGGNKFLKTNTNLHGHISRLVKNNQGII